MKVKYFLPSIVMTASPVSTVVFVAGGAPQADSSPAKGCARWPDLKGIEEALVAGN